MTSRVGSPDTQSDADVRACLDAKPPRSFIMVAGAGSGKTTSLIKAMAYLGETQGSLLRRAGQKIACITYTEVAVKEISADVGESSLFHISTIHSFLWSIMRPFHSEIMAWVASRIAEKIDERREHHARPRTQSRTRTRLEQEIQSLEAELAAIGNVEKFTYGTGSGYADGILGHDDILKLVPASLTAYPLLRKVVAKSFPYIFVDESQDTIPQVVDALQLIAREHPTYCLGFFGDPMQKIYMGGAGAVQLKNGWTEITKPENFRCPTSVLNVINAIRSAGDQLTQVRGRTSLVNGVELPVVGTANLFVLPTEGDRSARLATVREWLSNEIDDRLWQSDLRDGDVRVLVLVHRMAANRLGFPELFRALTDQAPMSLSEGVSDGTAWPLRPFVQHILPLVVAARTGDHFAVMSILRKESPNLEPACLRGVAIPTVLAALQEALNTLLVLMDAGSQASVRDVLTHVRDTGLLRLDELFDSHLIDEPVDDETSGFRNVQAYLECSIGELWAYRRYFTQESPFATHHGVKGIPLYISP